MVEGQAIDQQPSVRAISDCNYTHTR